MKNVVVFDVAAESKGALIVLNDAYRKMLAEKSYHFDVILSVAPLQSSDNVTVHHCSWIKNSWFHRCFFDFCIANRLISKLKADVVVSLQNTTIPGCKVRQVLFLQNILPFAKYHYGITEDFILWVYQNIIGLFIRNSVKKADTVIVQAEWIKNVCVESLNLSPEKFIVERQQISIPVVNKTYSKRLITQFFYPASAMSHKNHMVIVKAVHLLVNDEEVLSNGRYKVVLTITGKENKYARKLARIIGNSNLPITLVGAMDYGEVQDFYRESILVFSSIMETVGLPLLEAKVAHSPILAADLQYAHETIGTYDRVEYFNINNAMQLSMLMKKEILKLELVENSR